MSSFCLQHFCPIKRLLLNFKWNVMSISLYICLCNGCVTWLLLLSSWLLLIPSECSPCSSNATRRFEDFVYLTQVVQSVCIEAEIEHYRRIRNESWTMGTLYWQLVHEHGHTLCALSSHGNICHQPMNGQLLASSFCPSMESSH